jgi:hypothetical protein
MSGLRSGLIGTLIGSVIWATPAPTGSAEIEGVQFADRFESAAGSLELQGVGLLRYRVVFRGYVAALYLPPKVPSRRALGGVSKRLVLEYFWSIPGSAFGPAGEEVLARTRSDVEMSRLRERLDRIADVYEDIEPGDRYALAYEPGSGTRLEKNGRPLATIEGADFAAAYYSIWLGADPVSRTLRRMLLSTP